eukprot:10431854-Karenia_brevis.AAC.1
MTLSDAGVATQLSDVTESQHQTVNMKCFGENGGVVPHEYMQSYMEQDGGSPLIFESEEGHVI